MKPLKKIAGHGSGAGNPFGSNHHDVALADVGGQVLARLRITDNAVGLTALLELLAACGDSPEDRVPTAIETPQGLLVACLCATGRPVYPVNPMAAARYRTGTRSRAA
jgi:hypothetical protein